MNASNSEAMQLGTTAQLQYVRAAVWVVDVAGLKTLGVMFNSHFQFDRYADVKTNACSYHLRAL
jgi:hypothetical protein